MNLKFKLIAYLTVVLLSVVVFLPTVSNTYIFDDAWFVQYDERFDSLSDIPEFFTQNVYGEKYQKDTIYRPIYLLSLYFNRAIFGHEAVYYHVVNLFLHSLICVLLLMIGFLFTQNKYKAFIPVLIFTVHPVHVDSVAFIHNRSDMLALFFLLASVLVLLHSLKWKNLLYFEIKNENFSGITFFIVTSLASIILFAALLSKEAALAAIPVFILFFIIKFIKNGKNAIDGYIVEAFVLFLLPVIFYLLMRYFASGSLGVSGNITPFEQRNFSTIFPTMSRIFADYMQLLILPVNLKVNYSDYALSKSAFEWKVLTAYFIHLVIIGFAIWKVKKMPILSFCIFSVYISLLPVSQIVPFLDIKAERFLYIPSLFYCLIFAIPFSFILKSSRYFRLMILAMFGIVIFYASMSFNYSLNFHNSEALWTEMVKRSPDNIKFNLNLGVVLKESGKCEKAVKFLEKSLEIKQEVKEAYAPLAVCHSILGNQSTAREVFKKGLQLYPKSVVLNQNYAAFNYFHGDLRIAKEYIDIANRLDPESEKVKELRVQIYKQLEVKNTNDNL